MSIKPGNHVVHRPAVIPGDDSQQCADYSGYRDDRQGDKQRHPGPVNHPGQQTPAQLVPPEWVSPITLYGIDYLYLVAYQEPTFVYVGCAFLNSDCVPGLLGLVVQDPPSALGLNNDLSVPGQGHAIGCELLDKSRRYDFQVQLFLHFWAG